MSLKTFRLRIDDEGTDRDLQFVNSDIQLSDNLDDNTGVSRRALDTELVLKNDAYDTFKTISDAISGCGTLDAEIRAGTTLTTLMYAAKIKLQSSKIKWDEDLCKVYIKLDADDDYTSFFDQWETEFNIFDGTTRHTLNTNYPTTRTQDCEEFGVFADRPSNTVDPNDDCLENPASWGLLQYTFAFIPPDDDWRRFTRWGRSEITGANPGGDWDIITGETPNVADLARPIFTKGVLNNEEEQTFEIVDSIPDGVRLNEIIETFLPTGYTVRSNFFNLNPLGGIPQNDAYQVANSEVDNILIIPKNSVKNYNQGEPDQLIETMTYKELTEMLKNQFNVEFRITGTEVRFEHVSYFEDKGQGIDITAIDNGIHTKGKNEYSYDSSQVARKETWAFMEEVSAPFSGLTIMYSCATQDDTDEINFSLSRVNNDIQQIISRPDKVSDEGFCFVHATLFNSEYYLNYGATIDGTALLPNYFMSLPSLIRNFHYYQRPFSSGDIDGVTVNFISTLRRKLQDPTITFPITQEDYLNYNPDELMRSGLGWGEVIQATYSEQSGNLTVKLRHNV